MALWSELAHSAEQFYPAAFFRGVMGNAKNAALLTALRGAT
jgi:hypothetical protein